MAMAQKQSLSTSYSLEPILIILKIIAVVVRVWKIQMQWFRFIAVCPVLPILLKCPQIVMEYSGMYVILMVLRVILRWLTRYKAQHH